MFENLYAEVMQFILPFLHFGVSILAMWIIKTLLRWTVVDIIAPKWTGPQDR